MSTTEDKDKPDTRTFLQKTFDALYTPATIAIIAYGFLHEMGIINEDRNDKYFNKDGSWKK